MCVHMCMYVCLCVYVCTIYSLLVNKLMLLIGDTLISTAGLPALITLIKVTGYTLLMNYS